MVSSKELIEFKYWTLISKIKMYPVDPEKIVKKNKEEELDTKKIIKAINISLNNHDVLDGGLSLYKKNSLLRKILNILVNYLIKLMKKYHQLTLDDN